MPSARVKRHTIKRTRVVQGLFCASRPNHRKPRTARSKTREIPFRTRTIRSSSVSSTRYTIDASAGECSSRAKTGNVTPSTTRRILVFDECPDECPGRGASTPASLTPRTLGFRSLINVTAKGINSLLTRTTNLVVPHRTRGPQRAARLPGRRHPGVYHITNPLANFGRSVDHFTASSAFLTPKARGLGERENY